MILSGSTLLALFNGKLLRLKHITVEVEASYWSRELLKNIQEKIVSEMEPLKGQPAFRVDLKEVVRLVQLDRRVHHVHVHRKLPNRLELKVKVHEPLALLMDKKGRLLPVSRDASLLPPVQEKVDLPILRGEKFHKRKDLRVKVLKMLEDISVMDQSRQKISEIRFDKRFGYVLYLLPNGVVIRLGKNDFSHKAQRVDKVIRYLESQDIVYRAIDARFAKKVIVKPRQF